jgi:membrane-bound lytic murein transglycosylase D
MLKKLLALSLLSLFPLNVKADNQQNFSGTVFSESVAILSTALKSNQNVLNYQNLTLDIPWDKPSFQFWKSYYQNRWNRLKLISQLESFKLFYPTIKKIFKEEGLPEELSLLAVVESHGNPAAISKAGAAGLWQLMPATARLYGLKVNWFIDERFDIEKSTHAAARYLKYLYSLFGRWDLAIAAYNAGPGTILKRIKALGKDHFWDLTKLPDETLNYVPKFYAVLSVAESLGIFKKPSQNHLIKIKVLGRTSLYRISKRLKVPYSITKHFNPQFKRRIVPYGYYVYLPNNYIHREKLLKYVKSSRIYVYVPRRAERITTIARRFGVSPKLIKELNSIRRNVVYRGQTILIVKVERSNTDNGSS